MSIYYILIEEFDESGNPVKSRTVEVFKDEKEMIKWFAYNYDNEYGRYHRMLNSQRCCKGDVFVSEYRYIPETNCTVPQKYAYRHHMLYDADSDRVLDIRNYKNEIARASGTAVFRTEQACLYRERFSASWRHKHGRKRGRKHHKSGHYKRVAFGKNNILRSDKRFGQYEMTELYDGCGNSEIKCSFPSRIRGKARMKELGWWDDYYAPTENNWKEKRIRNQWQYHMKGHYKTDVKEYRKLKACEEYEGTYYPEETDCETYTQAY